MTRNPANRSSDNARGGRLPRIPTLGSTCRLIREDLGLSRFGAQQRHGISPSYLFNIEKDEYTPTFETLEKIIAGYGLNPMQARHLRELRTPAEELAPTDKLRQCVNENVDLVSHLDDLEQREVLAAYLDPLWNVLGRNYLFRAATPGLEETNCIPVWLFTPQAKTAFVLWAHESAHSVATLKATLGRYRDSEQAKDVIRQLRPVKEVRNQWSSSIDVAYGRDTNDLLHLRDPATGELTSYRLSVADVTQTQNVLLLTAIRKPYSGPEPS
ncbi:helix-turn-helix domain-containing protein [Nocardia amamiensis]|uniref:helix-turn-helix domain-containing protein n=1 Tax=Nocardia amamiensis TaxID=404578 RepID=UPI00340DFEA1